MEKSQLHLRLWSPGDRDVVRAMMISGNVARFTATVPSPYEDEWFDQRIKSVGNGKNFNFAIELGAARQFVGLIGFHEQASNERKAFELGYFIDPKFWGRGIASQAIAEILFKLKTHSAKTAEAGVFFDNPASMRVLEKNGFERSGAEMHFCRARGKDALCFIFSRAV